MAAEDIYSGSEQMDTNGDENGKLFQHFIFDINTYSDFIFYIYYYLICFW
jgi:hypothetical protein